MGSIPREHTYWQYKCIAWMHCKSLWIKASGKCKCSSSTTSNKNYYMALYQLIHAHLFICWIVTNKLDNGITWPLLTEDCHTCLNCTHTHTYTHSRVIFCMWRPCCPAVTAIMSVCLNLASASCASRCVWSSQVVALSGCADSGCVISTLDPVGELLFETVGAEWSGLFCQVPSHFPEYLM